MHKKCIILLLIAILCLNYQFKPIDGTIKPLVVINNENDQKDALEEILDRGYIKVGGFLKFAPFLTYGEDGKTIEGFDIDIMHTVANLLSIEYNRRIKVEYIYCFWDYIIPSLKAGQFDIICSAMTITETRELEVDFTRWYYQSALALLVTLENPKNILTIADLNSTGIRIGTMGQTTMHYWIQAHISEDAIVVVYDNFDDPIADLKAGMIDCVVGDYAMLNLDVKESDLTQIVATWQGDQIEFFGMACREEDNQLRSAINKTLDVLLGENVSNPNISDIYNAIFYKWHGSNHVDYHGTVTSTEIPYDWYIEDKGIKGFEFLIVLPILIVSAFYTKKKSKKYFK